MRRRVTALLAALAVLLALAAQPAVAAGPGSVPPPRGYLTVAQASRELPGHCWLPHAWNHWIKVELSRFYWAKPRCGSGDNRDAGYKSVTRYTQYPPTRWTPLARHRVTYARPVGSTWTTTSTVMAARCVNATTGRASLVPDSARSFGFCDFTSLCLWHHSQLGMGGGGSWGTAFDYVFGKPFASTLSDCVLAGGSAGVSPRRSH